MTKSPGIESYDFLVVGGGLFGVYTALYLAGRGLRVILVEKERELMRKASFVNQARLHGGYHYPRSVATARMSDENKARFTAEHRDFILFAFEKYYAIDRYGSFTDGAQFERFCRFINIPCERVERHPLFNYHRLDAVYRTEEYTFDPLLIANYYRERLAARPEIEVLTYHQVKEAEAVHDHWRVEVDSLSDGTRRGLRVQQVINATYCASNAVNRLFGLGDLKLMHEISEMAFVTSPQLQNIGLTIMDGPFASLMPYGRSGLLSLSSVAYTHHKVSYDALPTFDCQPHRPDCRPDFVANCIGCPWRPPSNYRKMLAQIGQYLAPEVALQYFSSLYTIKSKLQASFIDDGRPTEITALRQNPRFYCIFAGKINSIYEIEKVVDL